MSGISSGSPLFVKVHIKDPLLYKGLNKNDIAKIAREVTYIIQLVHSFEVNIRICQPENSDVHRGEAEVNITFEG